MTVPEATMNEDYLATGFEDQIRTARETPVVQSVPIAQRIHQPADKHFRLCIFTPDQRHPLTSLLRRHGIHHNSLNSSDQGERAPSTVEKGGGPFGHSHATSHPIPDGSLRCKVSRGLRRANTVRGDIGGPGALSPKTGSRPGLRSHPLLHGENPNAAGITFGVIRGRQYNGPTTSTSWTPRTRVPACPTRYRHAHIRLPRTRGRRC